MPSLEGVLRAVDELAAWSEWAPLVAIAASAPVEPGVYMARQGSSGAVVYVGKAGERAGSGKPKGLRGRLNVYVTGKGLASGLGEAVFDRALADAGWVRDRLAEVDRGKPIRAKAWGRAALEWSGLQVRWATTADGAAASALEAKVLLLLRDAGLWNRRL
jgi:hypothetical protein